jgi:hypothetical protein
LSATGVALAILIWLVVVIFPPLFDPPRDFPSKADALRSQNDVRTTLLQAVGGLLVLTSAIIGAYFTLQTLRNTQEQLDIARSSQVTERFTRAVEQLGSNTLDVRLGGIQALARIARDSKEDCLAVVDILSAYVRTHSPWPPSHPDIIDKGASQGGIPPLKKRSPDIQAILTILGGLPREATTVKIDLVGTDLRHANLVSARIAGADLSGARMVVANLESADLSDTKLMFADLGWANLRDAQLRGAALNSANLGGARLHAADLRGANLQEAKLRGAELQEAKLHGANLRKAELQGAKLANIDLSGADLLEAMADDNTEWPEHFDWKRVGVIKVPHSDPPTE